MKRLFEWPIILAIVVLALSGCSSLAMRDGDCEVAYVRSFTAVDGLGGTACGGSAQVDRAKVDAEGISAAVSPVKMLAIGSAVEAVAPVAGALLMK